MARAEEKRKTEDPSEGRGKVARQAGPSQTEMKFLEAASRLFAEHGYAGTRVADIIRESGCSTGSFYHWFSDKESVFHLLLDRYIQETGSRIKAYQLNKSTHTTVWQLFHFFALMNREVIGSRRGFYIAAEELSLQDPDLKERLKGLTRLLADRFEEAAPLYADEIKAEKPEEAMAMACQLVITVTWRVALGDGLLYPADKDEFASMMADAACGILRAAHPAS